MSDAMHIVGSVAANDPEMRIIARKIALKALREAEFLIENGEPRLKMQLVRQFMAVYARELRDNKENEELENMKEQMKLLRQAILGRKPGDADVPDTRYSC